MFNIKKRYTLIIVLLAFCLSISAVTPVHALFLPFSLPDALYLSSTTKIPITVPDFTVIPSLADAFLTVSFSSQMQALSVPGGGWATWSLPPFSESATPRVLYTRGLSTVDLTFDTPLLTFGVEMEPNSFSTFPMLATFFDGAAVVGTIPIDITGAAGARLFAGATTDQQFTRVRLTAPTSAGGFAIAQVRYAPIPEPSTLLLLGFGLLGLGLYGRKRRKS